MPYIEKELATQVVHFVQELRKKDLSKLPGIAETLDWAAALMELNKTSLNLETVQETLGCLLKANEDLAKVQTEGIGTILSS